MINEFLRCHNCSNGVCEEYVRTAYGWIPVEYKCLYDKEAECLKHFIENLPLLIETMNKIEEELRK